MPAKGSLLPEMACPQQSDTNGQAQNEIDLVFVTVNILMN